MKKLFIIFFLALIVGCSHPLEVSGQGDIVSQSGGRDCALEEQPCKNFIAGDYIELYTAVPRAGWQFKEWVGCGSENNQCAFTLGAAVVNQYWFQTMPPLRAVFVDDPLIDEFEVAIESIAVRRIIIDSPIVLNTDIVRSELELHR